MVSLYKLIQNGGGHTKYLWECIKRYKFFFFLSIACVIAEAVLELMPASFTKDIIDVGIKNKDMGYILLTIRDMFVVIGLGVIFASARNVLSGNVSQRFGANLRSKLFTKVCEMSLKDVDSFEGGALVTRLTNDVTQIQNFINGLMRIFFKAPVICIGSIVMASRINIRVFPIFVTSIAVVGVIIYLGFALGYPLFNKVQTALDRLNTVAREYMTGIRLVKAFGRYQSEEERFDRSNKTLTDSSTNANRVVALFSPAMTFVISATIAVLIYFGARWKGAGDMQVGELSSMIMYMNMLLQSLVMISNMLNVFVRTKTSTIRISQVLNCESSDDIKAIYQDGTRKESLTGELEFKNVTFTYPSSDGEPALSNISFKIPHGETLGVIGPTGSGKTTLSSLLLRFYEPEQGEIRIGGKNILNVPSGVLRECVSIAPQQSMLFTGTISDNIRWGRRDADEAEMIAAASDAQANEFILHTKDGYQTWLGQGGVNLSGGQKQRVSIARALVKRPEILILDDCTSALDAVTEAKVRTALNNRAGITTIIITQRISTASHCSKILVLDNGAQAGFGTHSELIENCRIYREIYESQIGKRGVQNV